MSLSGPFNVLFLILWPVPANHYSSTNLFLLIYNTRSRPLSRIYNVSWHFCWLRNPNLGFGSPRFLPNVLGFRPRREAGDFWCRSMVPASPNFICHLFTRAIPKGLTFGLEDEINVPIALGAFRDKSSDYLDMFDVCTMCMLCTAFSLCKIWTGEKPWGGPVRLTGL